MAQPPFNDGDRVLEGVRFDVYRVGFPKSGGGVLHREVVVPPDAAVILPLLDDGRIVLIRNERPAVGKTLWELPAGTLEDGEDPLAAAKRELPEETGYAADRVEKLCAFYVTPGYCTEYMHVYVATNLTFRGQDLDETERIEVEPTPPAEAMAMVRDGRIVDAKTIAALLYYQAFGKDGR